MISNISLRNFRSYKEQAFEFDGGVNVIVGPNAAGKTNLLEAILYVCQGKSYKTNDLGVLALGEQWFSIDSYIDNRSVKVGFESSGSTKKITIEGKKYKRYPKDKTVPVVLFEPEHLKIVSGSPSSRREFIDNLIQGIDVKHSRNLRDYSRALGQRNALLKSSSVKKNPSELFAWNIRLSELGESIFLSRKEIVDSINKDLTKVLTSIASKQTPAEVRYATKCDPKQYASTMLKGLEANISDDINRGFTSFGPHRDDLEFMLFDKPASLTASRGEARSIVIALKIIELEIKNKIHDKLPLILLDDVFSELDGARRQALIKHLNNYQTFITTTDADLAIDLEGRQSHTIALSR